MTLFRSSLLLLTIVALASSSGCAARHGHPDSAQNEHALTVTGEGEAHASPDLATVSLGVEVRHASAQSALQSANQRMDRIISAVEEHGVAPQDIRTTSLNVHYEVDHHRPKPVATLTAVRGAAGEANTSDDHDDRNSATQSPRSGTKSSSPGDDAPGPEPPRMLPEEPARPPGHYVVRNTVIVSVRNVDRLGVVIGAAMQAGANDLHGLDLTLDDPSSARAEARENAVADALEKARRLAEHAGVELGPVIRITETGTSGPVPRAHLRAESMGAGDVPVRRGELTLTERVEVVFSLGDQ